MKLLTLIVVLALVLLSHSQDTTVIYPYADDTSTVVNCSTDQEVIADNTVDETKQTLASQVQSLKNEFDFFASNAKTASSKAVTRADPIQLKNNNFVYGLNNQVKGYNNIRKGDNSVVQGNNNLVFSSASVKNTDW